MSKEGNSASRAGTSSDDTTTEDYGGTFATSFQTLLEELEIELYYAPRPIRDSFYSAQLAKFEILNLIQYTRVLYLDADVLPLCNLDYLFAASDPEHDYNSHSSNQKQQKKVVTPAAQQSWATQPFFLPSSSAGGAPATTGPETTQ